MMVGSKLIFSLQLCLCALLASKQAKRMGWADGGLSGRWSLDQSLPVGDDDFVFFSPPPDMANTAVNC